MKKFLIAIGLGGLAYWFTKDRTSKDEFRFTELPPDRPDN